MVIERRPGQRSATETLVHYLHKEQGCAAALPVWQWPWAMGCPNEAGLQRTTLARVGPKWFIISAAKR